MNKEFSIPCLDGLRACAFLLVFLAHAGWDNLVPGGFGVTVFFFLSGYLITSLLRIEAQDTSQISLRRFYMRRVLRILPPMYFTLALVWILGQAGIVNGKGNSLGIISSISYFFNYAELLSHHVHLPTGMGLVWSLMIEEHFYLVFPLVYWIFIRYRLRAKNQGLLLGGICVAVLLWRYLLVYQFDSAVEGLPRWTYSATDARFDSILWGCILAILNNPWFKDRSELLGKYKGAFAAAGVLAILASILYREPHYRETLRYTLQALALYPIFYYCLTSSHHWLVRWLEWKPLRWIGWLSYSLYLIHYSCILTLQRFFPGHGVSVGCAALLISVIYAMATRYMVEGPMRKLRKKLEEKPWRLHWTGGRALEQATPETVVPHDN